MATEAQAAANRRNAANSTGPRTKQSKAIVAQNALRHGLLARQNVVAGEDPGQFEFHRRSMLGELKPVGPTETLFAERIVGLAWRLLRAERLANQAFDYLLGRELDGSEAAFPDLLTDKEVREMCGSPRSDPGLAVGRMLVKDCGRDKVLERLMLYEQRIESSLRRAMKDLRDLRAERAADADGGTGAEIPAQWEPQAVCSVPVRAYEPAEGAYQDVSSFKCEVSSGDPVPETSHSTPPTAAITPYDVTTNGEDSVKQSQSGAGVTASEIDPVKQSQCASRDGGHNLPCGGNSAKQSQSAATRGQPASDLEKQSQSGDEASCETKPIDTGGSGCDVCVRAD